MDYSFTTHVRPDLTGNKINITFEVFRDGTKIEYERLDDEPITPLVITMENISDGEIILALTEMGVPVITPENKETVEEYLDVVDNNSKAIVDLAHDLVAGMVVETQATINRVVHQFNHAEDALDADFIDALDSDDGAGIRLIVDEELEE